MGVPDCPDHACLAKPQLLPTMTAHWATMATQDAVFGTEPGPLIPGWPALGEQAPPWI
jgi:hypothetical protein